jgi:hypothetical protein
MRILSSNLVLHGRRGLKALSLVGIAAGCGSCAKFPANTNGNFTAITFTFKVAGQINVTAPFIYDVAITASPLANPVTTYAPLPTINSSNPNGRVAGSPNFFIEFNSQNPSASLPFSLYRFALSTEIKNPNDPLNPVNLAAWAPSVRGQIFNFTTPQTGGDPSTLSFTVYTNELADTDAEAQLLQSLQVNILTMTRLSNQGSGARVIDALGNSSTVSGLNQFLVVDLRYNSTYSNATTQLEPIGDTFGGTEPDVDISDFTITVQRP